MVKQLIKSLCVYGCFNCKCDELIRSLLSVSLYSLFLCFYIFLHFPHLSGKHTDPATGQFKIQLLAHALRKSYFTVTHTHTHTNLGAVRCLDGRTEPLVPLLSGSRSACQLRPPPSASSLPPWWKTPLAADSALCNKQTFTEIFKQRQRTEEENV